MIAYRRADISDVELLTKTRCEFLSEANGMSVKETSEKLSDNIKEYFMAAIADGSFAAWIAEDDGELVATSGISFFLIPPSRRSYNGKAAYISNIYTMPAYRRQGVAAELFRRVVAEAANLGCVKITLHATEPGRPVYEKFGFADEQGAMVYYLNQ